MQWNINQVEPTQTLWRKIVNDDGIITISVRQACIGSDAYQDVITDSESCFCLKLPLQAHLFGVVTVSTSRSTVHVPDQ